MEFSQLFLIYLPFLTYFLSISQLFHSYFSFLTYFSSISCLFLDFDYFSLISQLFLSYFPLISHLFLECFLILLCIQSSPQCSCIAYHPWHAIAHQSSTCRDFASLAGPFPGTWASHLGTSTFVFSALLRWK